MSKKLSRNVIKQYIDEYLKAYGAFTNAPSGATSITRPSKAKEKGGFGLFFVVHC